MNSALFKALILEMFLHCAVINGSNTCAGFYEMFWNMDEMSGLCKGSIFELLGYD